MRTQVILNPKASNKIDVSFISNRIKEFLGSEDYSLAVTKRPGEGAELASKAVEDGATRIIAVGGDGTVNEIINGIAGRDIPLAIIPVGGANDLATHLEIPREVDRAFFSNAVFAIIPVYAGIVSHDLGVAHIMLALFIYFAAIAHEWAHNVKETEKHKNAAIVAFAQFALSGLFGWIFWFVYDKPLVFGVVLSLTSVQMLIMCMRLAIKPSRAYARKFYIAGFTFFAVPLIGLIVDNLAAF